MTTSRHRSARLVAALLLLPLVATTAALTTGARASAQAADSAGPVRLEVLSGRGDLVTGGDALLQVDLPAGTNPSRARIDVDGRDVTGSFVATGGDLRGVVTGLALGENVVTATLPGGTGARLTVTNSPIGGPVFSGPQIQPWTCTEPPEGAPTDAQCNRPPTYAYFYKSTDPANQGVPITVAGSSISSGLEEYDPDNPPSDVATTTTDQGHEVPFIVREETGVSVRDEYKIAVLYDPAQPFSPTQPQKGYNNKLVLTHGASCDTAYQMGSAPDVLFEDALGRGFAVASHALDNAGHNCNIVTQAESLVVTKELVAERYGPIRYTIGSGCSGGSLTQQQVANAYPGVYQGITPACSFTDSFSSGMQKEDYNLLRRYFENPTRWAPGVVWTLVQLQNVYGHPNVSNPITFTEVIPDNADPSRECQGVPPEDVYHHETNPEGVRCSIQDYMINVFGEREGMSDGKAGRAADNVGIQYGLSGLEQGLLTPSQFVDVNAKVGGRDIEGEVQTARREADRPALERGFRTGAVNVGTHLDQVAIIDLRGPDPGAFHDVYRTYAMRERLIREHGTADNQVLWRGQVPLFGDSSFVDESIVAMDAWLAVVEQDTRDVPLAQKILEAREIAGVQERCTDGAGTDLPAAVCDGTVESYSTPRFEAGMPLADDTIKCQLVPLSRESYDVPFTDAEWETLQATFPTGVCDYTKPSVAKSDTLTWLTYQDENGDVVYGGTPMGDPPASVPFGPATTGPCDDAPQASVTDRDAAREVHRRSVDCVLHLGIAKGTSPTTYAPGRDVTREQMASFIVQALVAAGAGDRLPAAGGTDEFGDIAGSVHRDNVNRIARAGITTGTGDGAYSPAKTLTRAEMASFVVRAARLATGASYDAHRTDHFADVPADNVHAGNVAAGYEAGLFRGTVAPDPDNPASGQFTLTDPVQRDQMASFLVALLSQARS